MTIRYPLLTIGSETYNTDQSVGRNKKPIYANCAFYVPSLIAYTGFGGTKYRSQTFLDPGPIIQVSRFASVDAWIAAGKPTLGLNGTLSGFWAVDYNRTFWPVQDFRTVPEGTIPDSFSNVNHNGVSGRYVPGQYITGYQDTGYTFQETDDNKNGEVVNKLLNKWLSVAGNPDYNLIGSDGTTFFSKVPFHEKWRNGGLRPQFRGTYYYYNSPSTTRLYGITTTNSTTLNANNQEFTLFTSSQMYDSYKYAADYQTNKSDYPAGNAVKTGTVYYNWYYGYVRDKTYNSLSTIPEVPSTARPLYYASDGTLTQMTDSEIDEAFIIPAIEKFAGSQPWLVSSASSVAGYTKWNIDAGNSDQEVGFVRDTIMVDTRAAIGSYDTLLGTNNDISVIKSYYVHGRTSYPYNLTEDSVVVWSDGVQIKSLDEVFDEWAPRLLWYVTKNISTNKYYMTLNNQTTTESQTTYTALDGSTQYKNRHLGTVANTYYSQTTKKTRYVGTDDYRSQLWPSGTISSNSWYSYIKRPNLTV